MLQGVLAHRKRAAWEYVWWMAAMVEQVGETWGVLGCMVLNQGHPYSGTCQHKCQIERDCGQGVFLRTRAYLTVDIPERKFEMGDPGLGSMQGACALI